MEPKIVGGINIYAPIKECKAIEKEDGNTFFEVVIDNGSCDGIKLEYQEQKGVKNKGDILPSVIYYDEQNQDLAIRNVDNVTVFGSEKNDKITTNATNSIFKFKNGGSDIIEETPRSVDDKKRNNKIYIDSTDTYSYTIKHEEEDSLIIEHRSYRGFDDESSNLEPNGGFFEF